MSGQLLNFNYDAQSKHFHLASQIFSYIIIDLENIVFDNYMATPYYSYQSYMIGHFHGF